MAMVSTVSNNRITGFVQLERVDAARNWQPLRSGKWRRAVLQGDTLTCTRERSPILFRSKQKTETTLAINLQAAMAIERDSVVVQCRQTGKRMRIRMHPGNNFLLWISALYQESLVQVDVTTHANEKKPRGTRDSSNNENESERGSESENENESVPSSEGESPTSATDLTMAAKKVTFDDQSDVTEFEPCRGVAKSELYYTQDEIEAFRQGRHGSNSRANRSTRMPAGRGVRIRM